MSHAATIWRASEIPGADVVVIREDEQGTHLTVRESGSVRIVRTWSDRVLDSDAKDFLAAFVDGAPPPRGGQWGAPGRIAFSGCVAFGEQADVRARLASAQAVLELARIARETSRASEALGDLVSARLAAQAAGEWEMEAADRYAGGRA